MEKGGERRGGGTGEERRGKEGRVGLGERWEERRKGRKKEEWFLKRKTVGAVSLKQERMSKTQRKLL